MSIIERAASKIASTLTPGSRGPESADGSRGGPRERGTRNLIEESIDRIEASFDRPGRRPSRIQIEDDGPETVVGSQQGDVDIGRLKEMGAVTPDSGRSKVAEEYRLIKRPLLANAFGHGGAERVRNGNLIMVTSSLPGEGKTFTAINLAISMATELEHTVLLVDADVSKSTVMRYLGLSAKHGLIDVLQNPDLPLSDALIKTNIAKLTVLPAGDSISHATELLASSAMKNFVRDIASRYPDRIIIFDSPPLLSTSEASVLATYMGQIVFVVEAERTPQDAITDALAHLADCEHIGLVLNKVASGGGGGDYGYGYGYGGYGEYAPEQ
ncbi:MAG: XrtA-associated tyrosine autokinase [Pseudomonadota bacterium]|nr:XrtA-associated tyrosine autokinase [Pseudomonadota bacterium]